MSEMKPTPGPWSVSQNVSRHVIGPAGGIVASAELSWTNEISEANARLIAEAGTVFHETGLSPRQLVEMNAELVEALTALDDYVCNNITNEYPTGVDVNAAAFINARAALTKASASSISKGVE